MATILNPQAIESNSIVIGEVLAKGKTRNHYSVTYHGFDVVAESMTGQSFSTGENVLIVKILGSYKIVGKYGSNSRKRKIFQIKG